jgi:phosphoribosylglycinamide formyltransferase 1
LMVRLGVLVSGNGSNLQALLDAAARGELSAEIATVISNRPGVRALERAALAGVPALCISHREHPTREEFDRRLVAELRERQVDWVVFAGFMRLVTPMFLDAFPNRVLNIHPSLLPAFPGVDSGKQAFEYGVKVSGCTVHLVSHEMDAGPIVAQAAVPILETDTLESFMQRMHSAEHALLVSATQAAVTGRISLVPPLNPALRQRVRLLPP